MENSIQSNNIDEMVRQHTEKDSVIIDLGSGSGALARILLEAGYNNLHLVDIANKLADFGDLNEYHFYQRDLNFDSLPFADSFADFIVLNSVIEHLENPYLVVREAARVLKLGGKLLVTIPHIYSWRSKLRFLFTGNLFGFSDNNNHLSLYTKATFAKAFGGFKVLETNYSQSFIKMPRGKDNHFKIIFKPIGEGAFSSDVIYLLERL